MKLIKPVLWTAFGVVLGAMAVLTASRLQAQDRVIHGVAICTTNLATVNDFMNKQIGSGRQKFIQAGAAFCAW